jgi:hypothetical protein
MRSIGVCNSHDGTMPPCSHKIAIVSLKQQCGSDLFLFTLILSYGDKSDECNGTALKWGWGAGRWSIVVSVV